MRKLIAATIIATIWLSDPWQRQRRQRAFALQVDGSVGGQQRAGAVAALADDEVAAQRDQQGVVGAAGVVPERDLRVRRHVDRAGIRRSVR